MFAERRNNAKVVDTPYTTTTTYFEVEGLSRGEGQELRQRGYSKDGRPDLGQIVIGFAMTRDGIPVRVWAGDPPKVGAGNTADQNVVEGVKKDLNGWKLGRVVTVMDAGFNSADNRTCRARRTATSSARRCGWDGKANRQRRCKGPATTRDFRTPTRWNATKRSGPTSSVKPQDG